MIGFKIFDVTKRLKITCNFVKCDHEIASMDKCCLNPQSATKPVNPHSAKTKRNNFSLSFP